VVRSVSYIVAPSPLVHMFPLSSRFFSTVLVCSSDLATPHLHVVSYDFHTCTIHVHVRSGSFRALLLNPSTVLAFLRSFTTIHRLAASAFSTTVQSHKQHPHGVVKAVKSEISSACKEQCS